MSPQQPGHNEHHRCVSLRQGVRLQPRIVMARLLTCTDVDFYFDERPSDYCDCLALEPCVKQLRLQQKPDWLGSPHEVVLARRAIPDSWETCYSRLTGDCEKIEPPVQLWH